MIVQLSAENFTLFESFSLEFSEGFNVITGETGAGKSLLLGSIMFLLGGKPNKNLIKDPDQEFTVQGLFSWEDFEDYVPVIRVYTPKGKSKVYINGKFSTLEELSRFLGKRIEVYTQNSLGSLFKRESYLKMVDGFVDSKTLEEFKNLYKEYLEAERRWRELKEKVENSETLLRELEFKLREIEEINPREGELEELRRKREIVKRSMDIMDAVEFIKNAFSQGEYSILNLVGASIRRAERIKGLGGRFEDLYRSLQDISSLSSDLLLQLEEISSSLEIGENPEEIEERFFKVKELVMKYGSEKEALEEMEKLKKEIEVLRSAEEHLSKAEEEMKKTLERAIEAAKKLSEEREKVVRFLEGKIRKDMEGLGFKGGEIKLGIKKGKLGKNGIDEVFMLYRVSKDHSFKPFEEIASGGERSRMALILKGLSRELGADTLILDEIDTGVGGDISFNLGKKLKSIGKLSQVICVTHQAQVAAFGNKHFKVEKKVEKGIARAAVRELTREERLKELSSMALGKEDIKVAEELLERAEAEEG